MGMTKLIGRFLIVTGRNSAKKINAEAWLYPHGSFKEINTPFYKDWGSACLSIHIIHWRCDIYYRFGRLIPRSIPAWAK